MPKHAQQREVGRDRRFGRYVVGPRIGTGGMAVIDAAFEPSAGGGRLVALKRITDTRSNDASARRLFLREASIAMRIEHPNVVRTYEVGEVEGEAYIVMELLEGATLAELQRATETKVPLSIALHIMAGALAGIDAAHQLRGPNGSPLGLVHQDISPQNIHIASEGTTRILDFGVARLLSVDASRTDAVRGKACYLAPEQLQLGKITSRTDVFAAGIVLHELLTGAPLFPRSRAELAYSAILSGQIPTPRSLCPEIPEEIDAVARRALAAEPSARFGSAGEMRRALVAAQERAGIRSIDVAAVGEWVQTTAAPAWTKSRLEQDLSEAAMGMLEAGAELSTLAPRRASPVARRLGRAHPGRRRALGIVLGVVAVGLASLVVRGGLLRQTADAATVSTRPVVVSAAANPTPSTPLGTGVPEPPPSSPESTQSAPRPSDISRPPSSGERQKWQPRVVASAAAPSVLPRSVGAAMPSSSAPSSSSDPLATQ